MAPNTCKTTKKYTKKGTWTAEEDHKLAEYIETHGATKWKLVVTKTGLNRCEKSCRLRWLNYLRPSIKRGTFTDQEDDLILRLHKLLGNRWALIAGRIPGRTDNDIKNYWNSHLSKKLKDETTASSLATESQTQSNEPTKCQTMEQELANEPTESHGKEQVEEGITKESRDLFDFSEPFPSMEDFSEPFPSTEDSTKFLELDDYFLDLL